MVCFAEAPFAEGKKGGAKHGEEKKKRGLKQTLGNTKRNRERKRGKTCLFPKKRERKVLQIKGNRLAPCCRFGYKV